MRNSEVSQLKAEAYQLAKKANEISRTLYQFERKNRGTLTEARQILRGTSSGADKKVSAALGQSAMAIKRARQASHDAGDAAANYARSL